MDCIFIDVPKECSFFWSGECTAPGTHIIHCAMDHGRLVLKDWVDRELLKLFYSEVINSPDRVKPISGQEGRDIIGKR